MRASDADRERIARILHDAMGEGRLTVAELDERLQQTYAAKTLGDLVPLTADLPMTAGSLPAHTPSAALSQRIGGTPTGQHSVALMSGFQRNGVWVLPRYYSVFVMMGGGELDLTQARFSEAEATIQVIAFMGGVDITVPDDITVRVTGFGFMGAFEHKNVGEGPPGGPVLTVTGFAFMGGVDVHPPKRRKKQRDQDQLET